jgi:hypothetical protein
MMCLILLFVLLASWCPLLFGVDARSPVVFGDEIRWLDFNRPADRLHGQTEDSSVMARNGLCSPSGRLRDERGMSVPLRVLQPEQPSDRALMLACRPR